MTNLVDHLRKVSVIDILDTPSIKKTWTEWKQHINETIGKEYTPTTVLDLADNLADIFRKTAKSGRSQSMLKTGGVAWECLVAWYLNLCLLGSRTVVIKMKKHLVPEPIRFESRHNSFFNLE